jgi:flagella basal body P-ring formation protein FlgA
MGHAKTRHGTAARARLGALLAALAVLAPRAAAAEQGRAPAEQVVTAERVRDLCREAVEEALPEGLELTEVVWGQPLRLPRGQLDAEAFLEATEPVHGRLRARLEVLVDGESARVLRVQLGVRDRRLAVTALRPLRPGDVIAAGDVELRELPPGVTPRQPLRDLEGAVGQVATRRVEAGEVLGSGSVRPPALVRRRERVRIIARAGGVVVVAQGEPLDDGGLGDSVRVVCQASGRTLEARVAGPGTVEVW